MQSKSTIPPAASTRPVKPAASDAILESLGKAVTDPVKTAAEEEDLQLDSSPAPKR